MNVVCGWYVANSILKKSFEEKNYITPLKLNCLVYLLSSEYLYLNGECLSNELFEKTKYGPVLPSIYFKFNSFGNRVITKYAKDATGKIIHINGIKFDESLLHIWEKFKNIDDATIISYIGSGSNYSKKEMDRTISEREMLMDEIDRQEKTLEKAKVYTKNTRV